MGLNDTPSGERLHIGFFGVRNAGKSSVLNAVTAQNMAIVSPTPGTTTDPVYKAMELLPLGPVMLIDTPGIDDEGELGALRVKKTRQALNKVDIAVLVTDATRDMVKAERELISLFCEKNISFIIAKNKCDLLIDRPAPEENAIYVSAVTGEGITELKESLPKLVPVEEDVPLVRDLLKANDVALMVVPVDSAAPKGRLILPQQQVLRDALDAGAVSLVTKETELRAAFATLKDKPKLVITDSQAFKAVSEATPDDVLLTSFSILMARRKGVLDPSVKGVRALRELRDGDTVLIAEGCTHHRQCGDIGTVKIPAWLRKYTMRDIKVETVSGTEFPSDLSRYKAIIHCGGCMLNSREMRSRLREASEQGVPMTNYGVCIAETLGILARSLSPFPELMALVK